MSTATDDLREVVAGLRAGQRVEVRCGDDAPLRGVLASSSWGTGGLRVEVCAVGPIVVRHSDGGVPGYLRSVRVLDDPQSDVGPCYCGDGGDPGYEGPKVDCDVHGQPSAAYRAGYADASEAQRRHQRSLGAPPAAREGAATVPVDLSVPGTPVRLNDGRNALRVTDNDPEWRLPGLDPLGDEWWLSDAEVAALDPVLLVPDDGSDLRREALLRAQIEEARAETESARILVVDLHRRKDGLTERAEALARERIEARVLAERWRDRSYTDRGGRGKKPMLPWERPPLPPEPLMGAVVLAADPFTEDERDTVPDVTWERFSTNGRLRWRHVGGSSTTYRIWADLAPTARPVLTMEAQP